MADEIQEAQDKLARDLDRAGEDKELAKQVREAGEQFARLLYGILRMTRIHDLENKAFDAPIRDVRTSLQKLYDLLGAVHLICVEDQVYVNDVRIRFESGGEHVTAMAEDLKRHAVGGISFNEVLTEAQLKRFVDLLAGKPEHPPRTSLQQKLNDAGMITVELQAVFRFRMKGEVSKRANREFSEVYKSSAGCVGEVYANIVADRMPNPLPIRRMVNELVDTARSIDAAHMAREVDETLPNYARHTLMVTNLSVLIGRAAGLSDATLGDLGVAAMFHDVGYSLKEDGYDVPYERHTTAGMRTLMKQRGFHEAKIRRLLAVLEHHRPDNHPGHRPTLFSRIIHIADDYDIITRNRPNTGPIMAQPDAVTRMAAYGGTLYDPILLQIFVNCMGLFPPGSLLRLASGRLVTSVTAVRSPETFDKPLCSVVMHADRSRPTELELVDLAMEDRIVKVIRPTA